MRKPLLVLLFVALFAGLLSWPACDAEVTIVNGNIIVSNIAEECTSVVVRIQRRGDKAGIVRLARRVQNGRVSFILGPEFVPNTYQVDDIRIECRNAEGDVVRTVMNKSAITVSTGDTTIDTTTFE